MYVNESSKFAPMNLVPRKKLFSSPHHDKFTTFQSNLMSNSQARLGVQFWVFAAAAPFYS